MYNLDIKSKEESNAEKRVVENKTFLVDDLCIYMVYKLDALPVRWCQGKKEEVDNKFSGIFGYKHRTLFYEGSSG
jgi:DUF2075 family protein